MRGHFTPKCRGLFGRNIQVPFFSGITAIANLAAAETNPSAITAASTLTIPALLIAGGNDCITPAATNQLLMYNALSSSCKNFVSINGASHCLMGDFNLNCSLGEATCTPAPAITREVQQEKVFQYLSLWLDATLKENCQAGIDFEVLRDNDTSITFLQSCNLCVPTFSGEQESKRLVVFPNPFDNFTKIELDEIVPEMEICIYDVSGRLLKTQFFYNSRTVTLDYSSLSSGTYFLQLLNVVKGEEKQLLVIKK